MTFIPLLWLIPLLPLAGFLVNGLLGARFLSRRAVTTVGGGAVLLSFLVGLGAVRELSSEETLTAALRNGEAVSYLTATPHESGYGAVIGRSDPESGLVVNVPRRRVRQLLYNWVPLETLTVRWSYALDPLSAVMLLLVTGIGFAVHLNAARALARERGSARDLAILNLLVAMMLVLVLADNFLVMFVGWQGLGLCFYLLFGPRRRAFLVSRVGDYGFMLGALLILSTFGSLDFGKVLAGVAPLAGSPGGVALLTAMGLLIFFGAAGKAAQIPSTTGAALAQAATVVAGGVYMIVRCWSLYVAAPWAMAAAAAAGAALALLSTAMAVTGFLHGRGRGPAPIGAWVSSRVDELCEAVILRPLRSLARLSDAVDCYVVDMVVNVTAIVTELTGHVLKRFQTGEIRAYALASLVGVVLILGYMVLV